MNTTELEALATLLSNRSSTYSLLSRLYGVEVDATLLEQLKQMNLDDESGELDVVDIQEGYRLWKDFLARTDAQTLTDLAIDYVRAFIGAGTSGHAAAYPYESVYTSPDHLLMQEARDEVRRIYVEEGLARADEFNEPEDHIAIELDFMAHLSKQTAGSLRSGDVITALAHLTRQQHFLAAHLLNWVPRFCDDALRFSKEDLYRGLAKVTRGFLELDREVIDDLISELS